MMIRENRKWLWLLAAILVVAGIPAAIRLIGFLNPPERQQPAIATEPDFVTDVSILAVPPAREKAKLTLAEGEREYLWQIEHLGLVLGRHGFQPLANALSRGDRDALRDLLASGFLGLIPDKPHEVRLEAFWAHALRQEFAGRSASPGLPDPDRFLARLMEYRKLFSNRKPPKAKLALMALAPEKREDSTGVWHGTCQLRMWGETASKPPSSLKGTKETGGPAEVILYLAFRIAAADRGNPRQGPLAARVYYQPEPSSSGAGLPDA